MAKPVANTVGTIAPPVKPCNARKKIIDSIFHDNPHPMLLRVNSAAEALNSQRVESACVRKAENGIITSSAIRYEVCTQLISSGPAESPACTSFNEAATI